MTTKIDRRTDPKQTRGQKTIDGILAATADLLEEVGFERLSTNMICTKAGLTPPALYRYFPNKYAILCELGSRLMDEQNAALLPFATRFLDENDPVETIQAALTEQLEMTEQAPGGRWMLRALHATPDLCDVRTQSHNFVAERLTEALLERHPDNDRAAVLQSMRLVIELGFSVVEFILDEPKLDRHAVLREMAELVSANILRYTRPS
jgi:AcrR family transcriptional regulator